MLAPDGPGSDGLPQTAELVFANLLAGDPLPELRAPCAGFPSFVFKNFAGRYHLYGFFLAADSPEIQADLRAIRARRGDLFDDDHCSFTGVSIEPQDQGRPGLEDALPGVRMAWDFARSMSQACGAFPRNWAAGQPMVVRRKWILVDPSLRVLRVWSMKTTKLDEVLDFIAALPPPDRFGGVVRPAPILMIPNVFEPEVCQALIALHNAGEQEDIGVHRAGQTVVDARFKRRRDVTITDPELIRELDRRISRRVVPDIEKLFFMKAEYIERHVIGCYSAEDGGHFLPHTDNSPGLTAHRRYAVSVNLSDDFDGGEVVFPEYNMRGYKAPAGWAVVFPCAILHAVNPVTRGARYAFLPFVYDAGGRAIRQAERARLASEAPGG